MRCLAIIGLLFASSSATICGVPGIPPDPPFSRPLPPDTLVAFTLYHGGVVGGTSEVTVRRDGRATILAWPNRRRPPREVQLSERTLKRIENAVDSVDFASLRSGPPEGYVEGSVVSLAAEGRSLRYVSALTPPPAELRPLIELLRGVEKEFGRSGRAAS